MRNEDIFRINIREALPEFSQETRGMGMFQVVKFLMEKVEKLLSKGFVQESHHIVRNINTCLSDHWNREKSIEYSYSEDKKNYEDKL